MITGWVFVFELMSCLMWFLLLSWDCVSFHFSCPSSCCHQSWHPHPSYHEVKRIQERMLNGGRKLNLHQEKESDWEREREREGDKNWVKQSEGSERICESKCPVFIHSLTGHPPSFVFFHNNMNQTLSWVESESKKIRSNSESRGYTYNSLVSFVSVLPYIWFLLDLRQY